MGSARGSSPVGFGVKHFHFVQLGQSLQYGGVLADEVTALVRCGQGIQRQALRGRNLHFAAQVAAGIY